MKKFLTVFFVALGVIFFVLLVLLAYVWFADPFEIRPLIGTYRESPSELSATAETGETSLAPSASTVPDDKNPNLTAAQANALEIIGVDVTALPTEITADQMTCFTRVLGATRVAAIEAGAAPTPIEILKAKECI